MFESIKEFFNPRSPLGEYLEEKNEKSRKKREVTRKEMKKALDQLKHSMAIIRNKDDTNIIAIYPYGSEVYGTTDSKSDKDYVCVCRKKTMNLEVLFPDNLYTLEEFEALIEKHNIMAIECIFLPENECIKHTYFDFILDKEKLRRSIAQVCSNSYVKCKKKLADGQIRIGKKSLWHSFRIALMMIDLVETGSINYTKYNHIWREIMNDSNDFEVLHAKYKPRHNKLMSEFRVLCPIDKDKKEV